MTPTYLSALFKKEMGIGLAEYLLHTRLEHVKRGLQNSTATVKELSEQAGFPDYQHFCKTFRKKLESALANIAGNKKVSNLRNSINYSINHNNTQLDRYALFQLCIFL